MSQLLRLFATSEEKPRQGGYEFYFDLAKSLWLAPQVGFLDDFDMSGVLSSISQWNPPVDGLPLPPRVPVSASHLWEKPEVVTEEIIAYRAWTYDTVITPDGAIEVRLESQYQEYFWDGPVTVSDKIPAVGSDHGLYALGLQPHHEGNWLSYITGNNGEVWGRVALSGIVVEGDCGYRAERATIQELWVNPEEFVGGYGNSDSPEGLCKLLGDRYQCDVSVRVPRWEDFAHAG